MSDEMTTLDQRARELLAQAYDNFGWHTHALRLRNNAPDVGTELCAVKAIIAALEQVLPQHRGKP